MNKSIPLKTEVIILIIITAVAIGVRFYNFSNRINFGPEQAISLIVSADYITDGFSLLGLPNVQRFTSSGYQMYSGSLFNYSLVPLMIIFDHDPLMITGYFGLLNLFTGLFLYFLTKKILGFKVAIFSLLLFLFNEYMMSISMYVWILNYLPIIGLLSVYFLYKFIQEDYFKYPLLLGVLSGVGFNLQYMYLFTGLMSLLFIIYFSKRKIVDTGLFMLGSLLGNATMIFFDLRHDFFHLRILWEYFLDTIRLPSQSNVNAYHFYQFWPLLAIVGGIVLKRISDRKVVAGVTILVLYFILNIFTSKHLSFTAAVGMPNNLTYPKLQNAAETIKLNNPAEFNVVTLYDFDSRAHPLRYLLKHKYSLNPLGTTDYKQGIDLYVLAPVDYDFGKAIAWEINTSRPFKVDVIKEIDEKNSVYKLTPIDNPL